MNAAPLTVDDIRSPTWLRFVQVLENRRAELHKQLEKDSDERTTAKLRGRLAEIKELLALQAPAPASDPAAAALGFAAFGPDPNP